jgi:hypothetical protein
VITLIRSLSNGMLIFAVVSFGNIDSASAFLNLKQSRFSASPSLASPISSVSSVGLSAPTPSYWCVNGLNEECEPEWLKSKKHLQVLVLSAGYEENEYSKFLEDSAKLVERMTAPGTDIDIYSTQRAESILYLFHWTPDQPLGPESRLQADVISHPIRGRALTLNQSAVIESVNHFRDSHESLTRPDGILVILNHEERNVTANASLPSHLEVNYGIARITRAQLNSYYLASHEIAHSALNLLDEYVEAGFENMNIRTLDTLSSLAFLSKGWSGWMSGLSVFLDRYPMKISEIIAANGPENIDVTPYTARVRSPGFSDLNKYFLSKEGGMFFGKGTYHDAGSNLMNSDRKQDGEDDGFAYAHSPTQNRVIQSLFENETLRPNHRIKNIGPNGAWRFSTGSETYVMIFDGDKNHHTHPTQRYDLRVEWDENEYYGCRTFPFVCQRTITRVVQKSFEPELRTLDLHLSSLKGLSNTFQRVLCGMGIQSLLDRQENVTINLCELSTTEMAEAFLPSVEFILPYQEFKIPTPQRGKEYRWYFRTDNGTYLSGFTGASKLRRTF